MTGTAGDALRVEVLGPHHDRAAFESGVEPLDRYFRVQAGQDARKNMAAPFVLVLPDGAVGGYYTLSATSVNLAALPARTVRKLPRYPLVPATLLGRLAELGRPLTSLTTRHASLEDVFVKLAGRHLEDEAEIRA